MNDQEMKDFLILYEMPNAAKHFSSNYIQEKIAAHVARKVTKKLNNYHKNVNGIVKAFKG